MLWHVPPLIYGIVRRLSDLNLHTVDGHCVRSTLLWSSVPLRDVNILFKCTICQIQVSNGPFILVFFFFSRFSELRKGVRCIQSYTRRCMDLQQRNQFNKLYHGTNQFIRDLCNKGEFQDGKSAGILNYLLFCGCQSSPFLIKDIPKKWYIDPLAYYWCNVIVN